MFVHNIIISIRNFKRYKVSFLINLLGLVGGLVTTLFIYLWVSHELSVDTFHKDEERIFRLVSDNGGNKTLLNTSSRFALELAEAIPEMELLVNSSWDVLQSGLTVDETTYASVGDFGSADFFRLFSYPLIHGDSLTLLDPPNSIVLSESTALKLFNTTDVVGESLEWRWFTAVESVVVTGVFEDLPVNSSVQLDYVLSFQVFERRFQRHIERGNRNARSFFKLKANTDVDVVNQKIAQHTRENYPDFNLRPYILINYSGYYLRNQYVNGEPVGGRIVQVRLFALIGVLILIIACVNFMNLATARAVLRAKEIGVRKVMGARKKSLINQFLTEACILSFLSGLASISFIILFFPAFEQLVGHPIKRSIDLPAMAAFITIILGSGLLSGSYPAFYLSGFNPIRAIKGQLNKGSNGDCMRKGLVIFQFSISFVLITSVLVIFKQMEYIRTKDLGYENKFIINFRTNGMNRETQQTFLQEVRKISGVTKASGITHALFGAQRSGANITWVGKDPEENIWFEYGSVDQEMLELLEMEPIQGRFFDRSFQDERSRVVINEATKDMMQMENPVGETFTVGENDYEIIGVASNFHFQSLHEEIKPTFFMLNSGYSMKLALRLHPESMQKTLKRIETLYAEINAGYPFEYSFHDQDQQRLYDTEQRTATLSGYASVLAITISCLGLFGLISFITEQRAKEMSIRKVLGASSRALILSLSKDVRTPLAIATVLGVISSMLALETWLNGFAYRISIEWWYFALSILVIVVLAVATISTQIQKTLKANPVDTLKDD